jgi:hypothetical protein
MTGAGRRHACSTAAAPLRLDTVITSTLGPTAASAATILGRVTAG